MFPGSAGGLSAWPWATTSGRDKAGLGGRQSQLAFSIGDLRGGELGSSAWNRVELLRCSLVALRVTVYGAGKLHEPLLGRELRLKSLLCCIILFEADS